MYVLDISASPPISLHAPSFSPSHSSSSLASSSHNSNSSAGGDHDITTVVIDTVSIALYLTMGLVTAWRLLVHIKDHYTNSTRSGPPQSQSPSPPPSPSPSPSPSRSTAMVEGSSFSHNGTGNSAEYDNSYYAAPNQKKLESASRKKRRKDCLCACCRACDSRLVQFHWFLFSFFMVTIVYWLLSILIHQAVEATRFNVGFKYALGTLSHCLFFTAVLLMLVHMLEHMYAQSTIAIPYVILWVSISVPYTYTLLTTLYFIVNPDQYKDGNIIYDSSIITICVYNLLCGVAYIITAVLVIRKMYALERSDVFFKMKKRPVYLLVSVMSVCFVGFLLQCAMLLYRPITGDYMNQYVFEVFTYWLPEIAISVLLLIVARRPKTQRALIN